MGTDTMAADNASQPDSSRPRGARILYAPERQRALVGHARAEGRVSVVEAAERFQVTPETIRRDLDALVRAGLVRRVHGGAIPAEHDLLGDRGVAERDATAASEKDRIAVAALDQLPTTRPASLVLDAGTTTARLAALLSGEPQLRVFTNSPLIATGLAGRFDGTVELSGGRVRGMTQACVGPRAMGCFQRLRVDVAFIGTNGISATHGLSTPDPDEAALKAAMVACARRVVVLADSRKMGAESLTSFCALDDIDVLVTDSDITEASRRRLIEKGIEVVVA